MLHPRFCFVLAAIFVAIAGTPSLAQVPIGDGSLGTAVTAVGADLRIDGGARSGGNLFHSFQEFSIPTGNSATFNNALDVQNIFSRVTGKNPSNIDGTIRTNGAANLFLLNPNGILFGNNAKLEIGGSFLSTTADRIQFSDGVAFSATAPIAPLLTLSVPIGLQLTTPAPIALTGTGHNLTAQNLLLAPFIPPGPNPGLAVLPGRTLALVGGQIDLDGGVLSAPSGRVEVGAARGFVGLAMNPLGFGLNYAASHGFGDIQLKNRSRLDANFLTPGSIQVQGRNIDLTGGSTIWLQNRGADTSGGIQVKASDRLFVAGVSSDFKILSSIVTEAVGLAAAGPIDLEAGQVVIDSGGLVLSKSFGQAMGTGTVNVKARDLRVQSYLLIAPDIYSRLGTATLSDGKAGNVTIAVDNLSVLDGGYLGATSIGLGRGGDVLIQAKQVDVNGISPVFSPSIIAASTLGLGGDAGDLVINADRIKLSNQGLITTSSVGIGSAGKLTVNATDTIEISSNVLENQYGTAIASTISLPILIYQQLFGLTNIPQGSSGNVTVTAPRLTMQGGLIGSGNYVTGNGGKVEVNVDAIILNDATINSIALNGDGGNVLINSGSLLLRNTASIEATAGGQGNGGNVNILSPIIIGLEDSDIIANASKGRGGNIQVTTQAILGLKNRPMLTPGNDITASSEFGVNGMVTVNSIGVDPQSAVIELPTTIVDPSQKIGQGCQVQSDSRFIATGRGGVAASPIESLTTEHPWADMRSISTGSQQLTPIVASTPAVEATQWFTNAQGEVELRSIAAPKVYLFATCAQGAPLKIRKV
jgi:filamentous hemagglutinin family protein